jgi:hypothetical protein
VTGCSRSGTGYAARLFSELGIPCGHEAVFNIHHLRPRYCVPDFGDSPWSGDASFLAAPFLEALPRPALVLHQLRHPLAVIRSHVGIRFFGEEPRASFHLAENHADFLQVVEAAAPEVFREPDEATRCAAYWVRWNRMVERSARRARLDYVRYRLEDLDGPLLERLLARMGAAVPRARIRRALADVPRDVNHRQREESVGLGHLGPGGTQDALCALARRYGYPLAPAGAGPGPLPA